MEIHKKLILFWKTYGYEILEFSHFAFPLMSQRLYNSVILHAQHYTRLPLRAVKPLGGVFAGKHLKGDSGSANRKSFGQMQNYAVAKSPGLYGGAKKCGNARKIFLLHFFQIRYMIGK